MYYKDFAAAREPLATVCENHDGFNDAFACFRLAELYQHGRGGPVDLAKAAEFYERACSKEYEEGCERRSDLAREGQGGPAVELEYAIKACDGGRPVACVRAAKQVDAGDGVERDKRRAIELYERGCGLGEVDGCTGAGDLLAEPGNPEKESRALAAYIRACTGHSGYGCLKVGIAFHDGIGTATNMEKAQSHFNRACEFAEPDGCHIAKQITASGGKPVEIELTTRAAELDQDGLAARKVSCRMREQGLPALGEVFADVARSKASLDACAKAGATVAVAWEFGDGRVRDAKIEDGSDKKLAKCVIQALRKAKISTEGSCEAVLLLGDPDGAAKSLAARIEKGDGRTHVRVTGEE